MYIDLPLTKQDIESLTGVFGGKTINQIRQEVGLTDVVGGDQEYLSWLKENVGIATPKLRVISNPFRPEVD